MATCRKFAYLCLAAAMLVLIGCASDAETDAGGGGSSTPAATGPAPGVTDDSIKIGITYVDTASLLKSGLDFDLGDHKAVATVYRAHADGMHRVLNADPEGSTVDLYGELMVASVRG